MNYIIPPLLYCYYNKALKLLRFECGDRRRLGNWDTGTLGLECRDAVGIKMLGRFGTWDTELWRKLIY